MAEKKLFGKGRIRFDLKAGRFDGVTVADMTRWGTACPNIVVKAELINAAAWCVDNWESGRGRKQWYSRFLGNWMRNAQERVRGKERDKTRISGPRGKYGDVGHKA